jgi:uncharacterized protein with HEPN domain
MLPEERMRLLKYLEDALAAAKEIHTETVGLSEGNYYFNNIKWLVERGIEIISEALKRANSIDPDLQKKITDLQKIYATRNKIAHEYDIVDPLQLYTIVVKNIPTLINQLETIIGVIEKQND